MPSTPRPFRIDIPDPDLADLAQRLDRTRWPDELPGAGWSYGINKAWLREPADYWRDGALNDSPVGQLAWNFPGDNAIQNLARLSHVITRWRDYDRGGHFPALQAPQELISDIFRSLPTNAPATERNR